MSQAEKGKLVVTATYCSPTTEGASFKLTAILDSDMPLYDAMAWARSRANAAVLISVELSEAETVLRI